MVVPNTPHGTDMPQVCGRVVLHPPSPNLPVAAAAFNLIMALVNHQLPFNGASEVSNFDPHTDVQIRAGCVQEIPRKFCHDGCLDLASPRPPSKRFQGTEFLRPPGVFGGFFLFAHVSRQYAPLSPSRPRFLLISSFVCRFTRNATPHLNMSTCCCTLWMSLCGPESETLSRAGARV